MERGPGATDWERVLAPRSVVLVGASGRVDHPMARPLAWLRDRGFAGRVLPVNPKYTELGGLPCHPRLADVPGPVDLVLALVPAEHAAHTVEEAAAVGAAAVVVFASGFAEVGADGATMQADLAAVARRTGVRVLGPNCQGMYVARSRLFATFTAAGERPLAGSSGIAYVGQSGAIGGSVLDVAASRGLDLTAWVSTGNQADIDVTEIGLVLLADPEVRVLAVYAEALPSPAGYARLAADARRTGTALVVLRSGRTAAGRLAALSHTGAMLADGTAFELVSREHGVVLVDDIEELLAAATLLRSQAPSRGRRVGAVTSSGGAGILAADRCADLELTVPPMGEETHEKLALLVPAFGSVANPVDVTAQLFNDGGAFGAVCSLVRDDPAVDAVLVLLTMLVGDTAQAVATDLAEAVAAGPPGGPPVVVAWMAGEDATVEARRTLREAGIPVFGAVAVAARVLAAVAPRPAAPAATTAPVEDTPGDGWDLLAALGVPTPVAAVIDDAADAAAAVDRVAGVGGRAVLKAVAPGLEHKTEAGGVRLDVTAATAPAEAAGLLASAPEVLVQQQLPSGVELLVSVDGGRDGWPPVLTVGQGGTGAEVHRDVAHALAPVTAGTARELLASLRCWPLLAGHRGGTPADVDAAVEVIVDVGRAARVEGLRELEVNPVIVGATGAVAVDVLVDRADPAQER